MRIRARPGGLIGFSFVWLGQFVSMIGTGMTRFALTIWAWQVTGQATALALVGFFSFAPVVLFSPLAGAIVDRVSRKTVMIASDLAAGLSTVVVLVLHTAGLLEIWHLYAAGFFAGAFESFQFPAYSAAITTMVDKKHYTRANAMLGLAGSASGILAPMLAAGPLADKVFEPLMADGGTFARAMAPFVGLGAGSGMGLMFVFAGLFGAVIGVAGYLFPHVRNAEDLLPDHDASVPVGEEG